jgi:hypothetical protein
MLRNNLIVMAMVGVGHGGPSKSKQRSPGQLHLEPSIQEIKARDTKHIRREKRKRKEKARKKRPQFYMESCGA